MKTCQSIKLTFKVVFYSTKANSESSSTSFNEITLLLLLRSILSRIVNHSKNVTLTFDDSSRQCGEVFRGKHKGKVFVTTHRMIFLSDDQRDNLLSFAVAFMYMRNLRVEQPIFGANYISGIVASHPNGKFFSSQKESRS